MDDRSDRLYNLLPAIYRQRDAEEGYVLKALLRVIAEQVNVVEDDIRQLYDNWFIETAQDWVVPYLGDLIGYQPVHEAGLPGNPATPEGAARNRRLIPRHEVADTVRFRRRKGTRPVLEELAETVADWPARAVEFYRLLGWNQNINHLHLDRGRTVDVRQGARLDLIGSPFDSEAHTVDVRSIVSARTVGRYNIPSVGVFVWRLKDYGVTRTSAYCLEQVGPQCYTFSVLGQDTPLYTRQQPEATPAGAPAELNLPVPIRRRALERNLAQYYGADRSFAIYADWASQDPNQPLPARFLTAADLTDWTYVPARNHIAVDPVLGRIAFPPSQLPKRARVSYRYAFSADLGGGEYDRPVIQPAAAALYRVGADEAYPHIAEALRQWQQDQPADAVIELADGGVYVEPIAITLKDHQSLQLRATSGCRAVIRLLDWQTDQPDSLSVTLGYASRFTLEGLLITGRSVQVSSVAGAPLDVGAGDDARHQSAAGQVAGRAERVEARPASFDRLRTPGGASKDQDAACPAEFTIRHCTLVPGWGLDSGGQPLRPAEPSLELNNVRARVSIEHSILGSIQVVQDEVRLDPIPMQISDSIIDALDDDKEALGAPGTAGAHVVLTITRSTVFGLVEVHAIELGENSIFTGCLNVARRQLGCLRFCYVPHGCRTPRRFHCQSDLAEQALSPQSGAQAAAAVKQMTPALSQAERDAALELERERVRPQFNSRRYGLPTYAQLAATCAEEISRGADDEAEMGAFHDLFQPQRLANLRARLNEYTPAGEEAGIILVN
jgi:hypothetical protein